MTTRNVIFALLGVTALLLKRSYAGALEQIVHAYAGNLSVSFTLYFAVLSAGRTYRHPRLLASAVTLAVVTAFEVTNGFGVMAKGNRNGRPVT